MSPSKRGELNSTPLLASAACIPDGSVHKTHQHHCSERYYQAPWSPSAARSHLGLGCVSDAASDAKVPALVGLMNGNTQVRRLLYIP